MWKTVLIGFCFAIILLVNGCTPERANSITKTMTPEEIIRIIEKRNAEIFAMRGFGQISIDTPELSNSGSIGVRLLKPDSLLVEITGPFGVGVAKGIVTTSDFKFYNGIENELFLGSTIPKNVKSNLRMSNGFSDIINLFAGCMSLKNHSSDASPVGSWRGNEYTILYASKDETVEYTIDTDYESVVRYVKKDGKGELIEEVKFKDFKRKSGIYIPYSITVTRPQLEQTLALFYETLAINESPMDFTLKIPARGIKVYL